MTVAASIAARGLRPTSCTARATATSKVRVEPASDFLSGQPRNALGDINVQIADPVSAVAGASGRHRIGDQGDPSGS